MAQTWILSCRRCCSATFLASACFLARSSLMSSSPPLHSASESSCKASVWTSSSFVQIGQGSENEGEAPWQPAQHEQMNRLPSALTNAFPPWILGTFAHVPGWRLHNLQILEAGLTASALPAPKRGVCVCVRARAPRVCVPAKPVHPQPYMGHAGQDPRTTLPPPAQQSSFVSRAVCPDCIKVPQATEARAKRTLRPRTILPRADQASRSGWQGC